MIYTTEKSQLILIALLKLYGIKKVIASAGTTHFTFVMSIQNDPWFEIYSAVDERSAAYMACGLSQESNEPVVITCTEATASRNYIPALTEAYYRKLPILAITGSHGFNLSYHRIPQSIDRKGTPNDIVNLQVNIPFCRDEKDKWDIEININRALHALKANGGGPVHINIESCNSPEFKEQNLPAVKKIDLISPYDDFPPIEGYKSIAIFCGAHRLFSDEEKEQIDKFCERYNAIVFCEHASNYYGRYRVNFSLVLRQKKFNTELKNIDLLIHIGETSGDYSSLLGVKPHKVWRISEDGELRDPFHKLICVFGMSELLFFSHYLNQTPTNAHLVNDKNMLENYKSEIEMVLSAIPELPFSNIWIAKRMSALIPEKSVVHFSVLNSYRAWNYFELPNVKSMSCNVGGFGIDGPLSTIIGASLASPNELFFLVVGDLAFFYDMNALGNRHISNNLRILLINNGKGSEFRLFFHPAYQFGDNTDKFIAGGGHFGNQSRKLVKHYAEDLGFKYISASTKEEFLSNYGSFLEEKSEKPVFFEIFTTSDNENEALFKLSTCVTRDYYNQVILNKTKKIIKKIMGPTIIHKIKGDN